jgi:hypothetical protein
MSTCVYLFGSCPRTAVAGAYCKRHAELRGVRGGAVVDNGLRKKEPAAKPKRGRPKGSPTARKRCAGPCGDMLAISRFNRHPKTADGRTNTCQRCQGRAREERKERELEIAPPRVEESYGRPVELPAPREPAPRQVNRGGEVLEAQLEFCRRVLVAIRDHREQYGIGWFEQQAREAIEACAALES